MSRARPDQPQIASHAGSGGPPQRSLPANIFYAIFGTSLYHVCQLGVLVLLAKFASAEVQGQFLFGLAIATPVLVFFSLQLRGALVADAGDQFSVGSYLALRGWLMLPASALLLAAATWAVWTEAQPTYFLILTGVFATRILWFLAEIGWGTFQRRERLDLVAWSHAWRGLALLMPFALLLPLGSTLPLSPAARTAVALWLAALGNVVLLIWFDRPRVIDPQRWNLHWSWPQLRALAVQTLPLGVVALIISLCDNFPRLLFESDRIADGQAKLGYFGSLAYITLAGNLVVVQATHAAANRISLYFQQNLRAFLSLVGRLTLGALAVGVVVLLVGWIWGRWILTVLYTPAHAEYVGAFRIILVGHCLALMTNVFGGTTTQMRVFWLQVPAQLVTLVVTVIAAVMLIPTDQPVEGAAWTLFIRSATQLVLYAGCITIGLAWSLRRRHTRPRPGK